MPPSPDAWHASPPNPGRRCTIWSSASGYTWLLVVGVHTSGRDPPDLTRDGRLAGSSGWLFDGADGDRRKRRGGQGGRQAGRQTYRRSLSIYKIQSDTPNRVYYHYSSFRPWFSHRLLTFLGGFSSAAFFFFFFFIWNPLLIPSL